jgi:hypothetical protein
VIRLSVLLVLALSLSVQPLPIRAGANAPTVEPTPLPGVHFVHVATADNTSLNATCIDHPLLNDDDGAVFLVTQSFNPKGLNGTYNDEAIGVYYETALDKWCIFNEDETVMPVEAAFNVHIPVEDSTVFVHEATSGNISNNLTHIDNPLLNDNPGATVFVTQNWNPSGQAGVFNEHVVGVWYDDYSHRWCIFNQDTSLMPVGASFNVLVSSPDEAAILHIATPGNTSGHLTKIDDPRINGNPNALLTVTQDWTPHWVYNAHAIGVHFAGVYWYIFNQDLANMPEDAAFRVLIPPIDSAAYVHVATPANTVGHSTWLDHPLLNGNPDAIVLATQHWNPVGLPGTYNDHHIGVRYDGGTGKWSIQNQDEVDMPEGAAFNVYMPPTGANAFTQVTTLANRVDNATYVDHPESNGEPYAVCLFTPNWNPAGLPGTYDDHATGIWYSDFWERASIYNEDRTDMPLGAAFNVLIPDDDAIVFIHTTTGGNTRDNVTLLDHPSLNGNPQALVYVTHNWNPGGGLGEYNDQALGVYYEDVGFEQWGIFNQDTLAEMPLNAHFNVLIIPRHRIFLPLILRSPSL